MRRLAKACCEMSRRDGAIVAWHEVPGTAPPQKPSRRVRCDSCRCAHRFDDWSIGARNSESKNRKNLLYGFGLQGLSARSYRTLRDGSFERRFPRHFVPGYDRLSLRDVLADIAQQPLARACCEMSRRDDAIVARHEVPGPKGLAERPR